MTQRVEVSVVEGKPNTIKDRLYFIIKCLPFEERGKSTSATRLSKIPENPKALLELDSTSNKAMVTYWPLVEVGSIR